MFIFVGENNCPNCGAHGRKSKNMPEILNCPQCESYFNEFGVIIEPQKEVSF